MRLLTLSFGGVAVLALTACGSLNLGSGSLGSGSLGSGSLGASPTSASPQAAATVQASRIRGAEAVAVNKYLWAASLEVLSFLPVQTADPFTGVISTGYGVPPGGSRAYRANILVKDPALDARSLHVTLSTRSGPVTDTTRRAVEDAILTRARQLRQTDGRL